MLAHLPDVSAIRFVSLKWERLSLLIVLGAVDLLAQPVTLPYSAPGLPGLAYTNCRLKDVPWSIHIVKVDRQNTRYHIHSVHASARATGLETLSEQLASPSPTLDMPVAAINGDFYERENVYAGAPRGLQIVEGELLSAPSGSASFWVDALGQPHVTNVISRFELTWPGGLAARFSLNGPRASNGVELYTPAVGPSTHTVGGREIVLGRGEGTPWLPLRLGQSYAARVVDIRECGDTPLAPGRLVLSLGPGVLRNTPTVQTGAVLRISTGSIPALYGVRTALSGGPVLVRDGSRARNLSTDSETYEFSSRQERHPRSAFGWNQNSLFLVEVDGRQKGLSAGMTLDELAKFLIKLGCEEAMNLDGGGSATLWYAGAVRNSPCDRAEREIANCLVIAKTERPVQSRSTGVTH